MWDLIVSVPDHCLSFYFSLEFESLFCIVSLAAERIHACNQRPDCLYGLQCSRFVKYSDTYQEFQP